MTGRHWGRQVYNSNDVCLFNVLAGRHTNYDFAYVQPAILSARYFICKHNRANFAALRFALPSPALAGSFVSALCTEHRQTHRSVQTVSPSHSWALREPPPSHDVCLSNVLAGRHSNSDFASHIETGSLLFYRRDIRGVLKPKF